MTFAVGCASLPSMVSTTRYKNDLSFSVNGTWYFGVASVAQSPKYKIKVSSHDPIDLFKMTTCHREFSTEEVKGTFWQSPGKDYEFDFIPNALEQEGACPMKIETYTKSPLGRHGGAFIDFASLTLGYEVLCNGRALKSISGVIVCESAAGLVSSIVTSSVNKVMIEAGSEECRIDNGTAFNGLKFKMPKGECVYAIIDPKTWQRGRLTLIGYDQIAIRGDK